MLYIQQARYEVAEPLLLEACQGRENKLGPEHPHTSDSLNELVRLYESWGKPEEAQKWRAILPSEKNVKDRQAQTDRTQKTEDPLLTSDIE